MITHLIHSGINKIMGRLVDVAKAARMLGVSRVHLQKLIRKGDLQTFEGKVDLESLQRVFPALARESDSLVEKTQIIRDSAYAKRLQNLFEPTKEDLKQQINQLKVQLAVAKVQAGKNRKIVDDLVELIGTLQENSSHEQKDVLDQLSDWLCGRFQGDKSNTG